MPKYATLGEGQQTYLLIWSDNRSESFSYNVVSAEGTAKAWSDYEPIQIYGNAVGVAYIPVKILEDKIPEPDEKFKISINANFASGAELNDYMEVTIIDNDLYKCSLDLDGDGVTSQVELSFTDMKSAIADTRNLEANAMLNLLMADETIKRYTEEYNYTKIKAALELTALIGEIASTGVRGAWGLSLALSKAIIRLNSDKSGDAIDNNKEIIDSFNKVIESKNDLSDSTEYIRVGSKYLTNLFQVSNDLVKTKNELINLADNIKTWQDKQLSYIQEVSELEILLEQFEDCVEQSPGAATMMSSDRAVAVAADEDCGCGARSSAIEPRPAQNATSGEPGLTFLSASENALLPEWLTLGVGTDLADKVVFDSQKASAKNFLISMGGGDDIVEYQRGSGIVDGGGGVDRLTFKLASDAAVVEKTYELDGSDRTFHVTLDEHTVVLSSVERVDFNDRSVAFDEAGNAGAAYRLYTAAFDRTPDEEGLGYWIRLLDKDFGLQKAADAFVNSKEFQALYGSNLSNEGFVKQLYRNVLDREGEAEGVRGWVNALSTGVSRAEVLSGFSESQENIAAVAALIEDGIWFV